MLQSCQTTHRNSEVLTRTASYSSIRSVNNTTQLSRHNSSRVLNSSLVHLDDTNCSDIYNIDNESDLYEN